MALAHVPTRARPNLAAKDRDPSELCTKGGQAQNQAEAAAELVADGVVVNAKALWECAGLGAAPVDLTTLADQMYRQGQAVNGGDMSYPEAVLTSQLGVLNEIFAKYASKAVLALDRASLEAYMRIAVRAQSNCRATAEALAVIKAPRNPVFAKQANITSGPQQINNTTGSDCPPRAREKQDRAEQTFEGEQPHERMDR